MDKEELDLLKQKLCLSCLKCCRLLSIMSPVNPTNDNSRYFYETRGCRILESKEFKMPVIMIPFPCPNLTEAGCSIYEHRPLSCRLYDGRKTPTMRDVCAWNEITEEEPVNVKN
jgi:Fe-S-cluster containining protein